MPIEVSLAREMPGLRNRWRRCSRRVFGHEGSFFEVHPTAHQEDESPVERVTRRNKALIMTTTKIRSGILQLFFLVRHPVSERHFADSFCGSRRSRTRLQPFAFLDRADRSMPIRQSKAHESPSEPSSRRRTERTRRRSRRTVRDGSRPRHGREELVVRDVGRRRRDRHWEGGLRRQSRSREGRVAERWRGSRSRRGRRSRGRRVRSTTTGSTPCTATVPARGAEPGRKRK